jgi:hypothetical protein
MCFLDRLPQVFADFMQAVAGSSRYELALLWSIVAAVCILVFTVLM